uniref:TBC1 domain family, member 22a n=1 Tax=Erpetoichthys calabaricus TaxID=27687 RepID=A0A8C4XH59_ERPCA
DLLEGINYIFWEKNVFAYSFPCSFDLKLQFICNVLSDLKQQTTPVKPKKATTFQEFESITSDAWDVGDDDDDELLAMAAQNLNIEVVMETANKVIENHSKLQEQQKRQEQHFAKDKEDDHLDEELHINIMYFVLDSVSEKTALQRQQSLPHRPVIPLVARIADQNTSGAPVITEREASRLEKFTQLLAGPNTDTEELRKLSWSGIPRQVRAITWKILSVSFFFSLFPVIKCYCRHKCIHISHALTDKLPHLLSFTLICHLVS